MPGELSVGIKAVWRELSANARQTGHGLAFALFHANAGRMVINVPYVSCIGRAVIVVLQWMAWRSDFSLRSPNLSASSVDNMWISLLRTRNESKIGDTSGKNLKFL